jgi:DNA-directed RNA polymerase specialized sigma24 family protein/ribosome-associated translation inhibitor RaiA
VTIPWNIVTKNVSPGEASLPLDKKLRQKIGKLERHLKNFPPDAVHLQIVLERHPRKPIYTATLNLGVPSNILHSEKSGRDLIGAFDAAFKILLRELESLKSDLRHEKFWKPKSRRQQMHQLKATGFALEPQGEGAGPQDWAEVVRDLIQKHYGELLRHASRHIWHDELAGDIPRNSLDARDIVHEVIRRALEVSTDEIKALPEDADKASGYDALRPLDIVQEELDPPMVKTEGLIRDPAALPPDEIVAAKDSITRLQQDLRNWPRPEREVFELYFVEGLEPEEIAMVTRQPLKSVRKTISSIQDRLREEMLAQEAIG